MLKSLRAILVAIVIFGLVALNIASLTIPAVTAAMSAAISTVSRVPTVYSRLVQSNKTLLQATGAMTKEAANLRRANSKLIKASGHVARLSREITASNRALHLANGELSRAATAASAARNSLQVREAEIASLQGKVKAANSRVSDMKIKVSKVTTRVRDRVAKSAARNISTVFGEALPYAGAAVVVGATGLELLDACGTMNDMVDLERDTVDSQAGGEDAKKVCGYKVPTRAEVWAAIEASPEKVWESLPDLPDMPPLPTFAELSLPELDWAWRPWN